MQALVDTAKKQALQRKGEVQLGPLAGAVMSSALVTLQPHAAAHSARFVMVYAGQPHHQMIEDLLQVQSAYVDPQKLSAPASPFEARAGDTKTHQSCTSPRQGGHHGAVGHRVRGC